MKLLSLTSEAGNKETVLKAINSLTRENYIDVFCSYVLDTKHRNEVTDFELGYIRALDNSLYVLGRTLVKTECENKTKEQLLDIVIEMSMEDQCSFDYYADNGGLDTFIRNTILASDVKFTIVKNYMTEVLDNYCEELEKTAADRDKERALKSIEDYERSIKHYQDRIDFLKKELEK